MVLLYSYDMYDHVFIFVCFYFLCWGQRDIIIARKGPPHLTVTYGKEELMLHIVKTLRKGNANRTTSTY